MYKIKKICSIFNMRGDNLLNIDLEYKRGILFLRLDGMLTKSTSFILKDALGKIIQKAGIKYLLINFEKLYKIDDEGIITIIDSYNNYIKNKGKLLICGDENIRLKIDKSELSNCILRTTDEISAFNLINL